MDAATDVTDLLLRLGPSETALLDWLNPQIDDSMLQEIAAADYGHRESEHFQALLPIRDHQQIPIPLEWVPDEVLELMRWSEPDDPHWAPGSAGTRGHLIRAFSCAVLLRVAAAPKMWRHMDHDDTLIQLIGSVLTLGQAASESALRFLCWYALNVPAENEDDPFFALGVLMLRVALFQPGEDTAELIRLADWVTAVESKVRASEDTVPEDEWLLGLTTGQKHDVWRTLVPKVLRSTAQAFPGPAADAMQEIVNRLVPTEAAYE